VVALRRLNNQAIMVNPDLIETLEATPDTVVTLTSCVIVGSPCGRKPLASIRIALARGVPKRRPGVKRVGGGEHTQALCAGYAPRASRARKDGVGPVQGKWRFVYADSIRRGRYDDGLGKAACSR